MHLTSALFAQKAMSKFSWSPIAAPRRPPSMCWPSYPARGAGHPGVAAIDPGRKLKALGVSAARRVAFLPDVPPLSEVGLSGFESVGCSA